MCCKSLAKEERCNSLAKQQRSNSRTNASVANLAPEREPPGPGDLSLRRGERKPLYKTNQLQLKTAIFWYYEDFAKIKEKA